MEQKEQTQQNEPQAINELVKHLENVNNELNQLNTERDNVNSKLIPLLETITISTKFGDYEKDESLLSKDELTTYKTLDKKIRDLVKKIQKLEERRDEIEDKLKKLNDVNPKIENTSYYQQQKEEKKTQNNNKKSQPGVFSKADLFNDKEVFKYLLKKQEQSQNIQKEVDKIDKVYNEQQYNKDMQDAIDNSLKFQQQEKQKRERSGNNKNQQQ